MRAFIAALIAIVVLSGAAAFGLGAFDNSSETRFSGDNVRLGQG
ncbi:hypothetical protein ACTL6U_04345 [Rhodovibrionaceae bacterium A322]